MLRLPVVAADVTLQHNICTDRALVGSCLVASSSTRESHFTPPICAIKIVCVDDVVLLIHKWSTLYQISALPTTTHSSTHPRDTCHREVNHSECVTVSLASPVLGSTSKLACFQISRVAVTAATGAVHPPFPRLRVVYLTKLILYYFILLLEPAVLQLFIFLRRHRYCCANKFSSICYELWHDTRRVR